MGTILHCGHNSRSCSRFCYGYIRLLTVMYHRFLTGMKFCHPGIFLAIFLILGCNGTSNCARTPLLLCHKRQAFYEILPRSELAPSPPSILLYFALAPVWTRNGGDPWENPGSSSMLCAPLYATVRLAWGYSRRCCLMYAACCAHIFTKSPRERDIASPRGTYDPGRPPAFVWDDLKKQDSSDLL